MNGRGFTIGPDLFDRNRVLIIAELGTGHGGSATKARELIDAAATAGADCVKFQHVYAEEILHPNTGLVPLPGGAVRLFDRFKNLECSLDFFAEIKRYAESKGLLFLCTPFGPRSARELRSLGVRAFKIASPELNYVSLIDQVASYGLPMLLSSGVSRLADIERALEHADKEKTCLLHCVTAYPAPEKDYNLRVLGSLGSVFGVAVGVSDHSLDAELVPALATAMGASAVEKHFCLSRDDEGLDDPIALPPSDFGRMVRAVREASRLGCDTVVDAMERSYGADTVRAVLGDGVKSLAPSERKNYERTNRSLHALRRIAAGEAIRSEDVACLRTEKVLRPGLPPEWMDSVVGRRAARDIPDGEGIRFEDI
jgi:sialic acid synthase SpsE